MKKFFLTLAFALSATLTAQAQKTFVYCSEGSPSSFNPQIATDGTTFDAAAHTIYNKLIEFKTGSTEIVPALAQSWKVSKDGLTYTFSLRKGVKFHSNAEFKPTRDFNADDVLFSWNRQLDKNHPYHKVGGGTYEYFESMNLVNVIKEIKKIDPMTVQVTLKQPEAPFLANMAMEFASILSAEYADFLMKKGTPEKIDNQPIGTGPFVFQSYQKDTMIRFKANPDYFAGRPKIDNLVFAITRDASVRLQKLRAGECQLINEPSPQDLPSIRSNPELKVMEREGLNVGYLAFNTAKPPFDKLEVRQAVHHALNRASYIDKIFLGRGVVAKNPLAPSIWSYNDDVKDYEYNVQKAKDLLKKAGFPNGFETEIWTLPVNRAYNPNGKKMGELMQDDLKQVGIKAKLITYDWPTYLKKARNGDHTMLQIGWTGDNGDPDNFLNTLLGCPSVEAGSNYSKWCNKDFDAAVQKARTLTSQAERTKLYRQAQVIFKKEAPWVTLAHGKTSRAMRKNVEGFVIHPFGGNKFDTVDLK